MDILGKITPIDRLSVKKFPSVQLSSLIPFNDRRLHTDNHGYLYILRKMYQSVRRTCSILDGLLYVIDVFLFISRRKDTIEGGKKKKERKSRNKSRFIITILRIKVYVYNFTFLLVQ